MAKIIVLDEFTAGQIAAGEVVERPVSAVKELVENALDAGASRITVQLIDGGLAKIAVSDNGCGLDEENARLAFLRHATSKIKNAADLSRVNTLGFRGEALPSIAAVAKVAMTTRVSGAVTGACLELQGGKLIATSPVGCAPGTTVEVKELFFNTPARRKAMKNPSAEGALCADLLSKMALARPEVRFELLNRGRRVFYTPGTGKLLDAITTVYGPGQGKEMIPVGAMDGDMSLAGYTGKPSLSRSSRSHLTIIINGRYVRCPAVLTALEDVYRDLLPHGRKPVAVLALTVIPEQLDVNVHPAKQEVHLLEEKRVANLVTGALKNALRGDSVIPAAVAERGGNRYYFAPQDKTVLASEPELFAPEEGRKYTHPEPGAGKTIIVGEATPVIAEEPKQFVPPTFAQKSVETAVEHKKDGRKLPVLYPLAQLLPTYILAGGADGLYIIDQHAAHERVLYEECLASQGRYPIQYLLLPETLELECGEAALVADLLPRFKETGFVIEHFGGKTFLLRGAPAYLPAGREKEVFLDMLDLCLGKGLVPEQDVFFESLAASIACKGAIKAGEKMPFSAMEALLERLAQVENPFTCPHGRPTIVHLSKRDLETRFKR